MPIEIVEHGSNIDLHANIKLYYKAFMINRVHLVGPVYIAVLINNNDPLGFV
jgi:hypothetical protein